MQRYNYFPNWQNNYFLLHFLSACGQPLQPQEQPPLPFRVRTTQRTAKKSVAARITPTMIVCNIAVSIERKTLQDDYTSRLPIWNTSVLTIQARPMV